MKLHYFLIIIFASIVLLSSCDKTEDTESLEAKKALLVTKKQELAEIQLQIDSLTSQIAVLDPNLKEKPKFVSSTQLQKTTFERYVNIQGNVVADDLVSVVSEVPGRIISLNGKEGQYVQRGQIIAKLDLESLTKQQAEIETSLSLAKDVYERQDRLWKQGIGSEVQYLQTKNNVERLEKSLETLQFQLTKSTIYAPISGVIDQELLQTGEVASPGMPIIQILNTSNLKIKADLPEKFLTVVNKGQLVELNFPSLKVQSKGRINMLGRSIDPANRTLDLEVTPTTTIKNLKPNLLTELKLKEIEIKDVIQIPIEFILQEVDGSEYVYVADKINGEWRAAKKYVETSESADGNIIVSSGLVEGEILVTKGTRSISENELLEIMNPTNNN